jgi:hypothetical protein
MGGHTNMRHKGESGRLDLRRRAVLIGLGASALATWPAQLRAASDRTLDRSLRVAEADATPTGDVARAMLYEEPLGEPNGKRFAGEVRWSLGTDKLASNAAPHAMVRADIAIRERQLTLKWMLRRNFDRYLPASHVIELMFTQPAELSHGGIEEVPGLLMKTGEQSRGALLKGISAKIVDDYFLVGLSNVGSEQEMNMTLLRERGWLNVPIVYRDGRRALLAFEKGPAGERAFGRAFAAWDDPNPTPASTEGIGPRKRS